MSNSAAVTFENFKPQLKPGQIIPQGRRIIYETLEGGNQIVLPIELADAILLSSGKYTMREIIEKVFKVKGTIHFKTLFKAVHQMRDHGFFENGHELETYSVFASIDRGRGRTWALDLSLARKKILQNRYPLLFYALSLGLGALGVLSLMEFHWPAVTSTTLIVKGSYVLGLAMGWLALSILLTLQSLLKAAMLLLLTGNLYGLNLRLAPWGFYLHVVEDSIFLVNSRLFIVIYYLASILSPAVLVWATLWRSTTAWMHPHLAAIVFIKIVMDVSPLFRSDFIRCVRALMSLRESDLMAGYLKDTSILSLLSSYDQNATHLRRRAIFRFYSWVWSGGLFTLCSYSLVLLNGNFDSQPRITAALCLIPLYGLIFTIEKIFRDLKDFVLEPIFHRFMRLIAKISPWHKSTWTKPRIADALADLPLFSYFSGPLIDRIIQNSEVVRCKTRAQIITQGQIGKDLFVLLDGSLNVFTTTSSEGRRHLTALRPISIFGEMAIVEECERTADVIAHEQSTILRVPAEVIRQVAKESQAVREIDAFKNAIMVNQFFASAPMFRDLSADVALDIVTRCQLEMFETGDVVFEQGAPGQTFYMVVRGSADVILGDRPIKRIRQGGFFGEIAVIADIPRTATVIAHEPLAVLQIAATSLWEILSQNIELAMFIESVGESRLLEDLTRHPPGEKKNQKAS